MITRVAQSFASVRTESIDIAIQMHKMGYPILDSYLSVKGIEAIRFLDRHLSSRKKVLKFVALDESAYDSQGMEKFIEGKNHRSLIILLGDRMLELMRILVGNKVSIHLFVSNLPKIRKDDDADEVFEFLKRILKFSEESMFEALQFMNYRKVREAKNLKEMNDHILIVKAARMGVTKGKERPAFMPLTRIRTDNITEFTKRSEIIATIGSETLCCFTKNGAAASLLQPAQASPIAGILHGYLQKKRWFSFVWEMVEVTESGFEKTLILDNIEARGMINDGKELWNRLRALKGYSKVYCGTLRNDITFEDGVTDSTKPKQSNLVGYEHSFSRYGAYDDSKNLYTVVDNPGQRELVVTRMDKGDLHRCKYVENHLYGGRADEDFLKIDIGESPSYIIESRTNIYGYFVTRMKYYREGDSNYYQFQDLPKSEVSKIKKENEEIGKDPMAGLQKVLYLEDIFVMGYRKCKASMKYIFEDLIQWSKENGVDAVVANTNANSKYFVKRIKETGFKYIEQGAMPTFLPENDKFVNHPPAEMMPETIKINLPYVQEEI
jgi:hypothetical protein